MHCGAEGSSNRLLAKIAVMSAMCDLRKQYLYKDSLETRRLIHLEAFNTGSSRTFSISTHRASSVLQTGVYNLYVTMDPVKKNKIFSSV